MGATQCGLYTNPDMLTMSGSQVVFRCKLENIIDTYRNRIKAMGYEPRRQEDIPDVMAAYCEAIANCKIMPGEVCEKFITELPDEAGSSATAPL